MDWDAVFLSRLQFAFTISFHIIFPSFTIGLASYLAVLEALWLKTGKEVFRNLYLFWVKIFALAFGMGVVSGVVMSYQFGTNWSLFSELTGNVLGPLLGYEVLTAFFVEASFLGIMIFGWNKVGEKLHFFSTCMVAIGTLISAFWILSANSWMHTPAGFELRDGTFYAVDWLEVIFNPSFPYRYVHMVLAAYCTTALVVGSVGALHLLRGTCTDSARVMLHMALGFLAVVVPLQLIAGHEHGAEVYEYQPTKLAAMEGHWETYEDNAPLILFAIPDAEKETNSLTVELPRVGSLIVTGSFDGRIRGLKEWPPDERPPVGIVFWSFRIMVGLGMLMLFIGLCGAFLIWRKRIESQRWFLRLCLAAGPMGFIAVLTGWFTAEVGRQPYTVYGLLRTADSVSPVTAAAVETSLIVYIFAYAVVFAAGTYYIFELAFRGPDEKSTPADGGPDLPIRGAPPATGHDGPVEA